MSTRSRSVPHKRPFLSAIFWTLLHWFALCLFGAALVSLIIHRDLHTAYLAAGALAGAGLTWLFSFLKRRNARCPLCKGTPYLNTGAAPHREAVRIPPLNHGITAMLSTILRLRFRCMYCGTPYDFLKPTHKSRNRNQSEPRKKHRPTRQFRG